MRPISRLSHLHLGPLLDRIWYRSLIWKSKYSVYRIIRPNLTHQRNVRALRELRKWERLAQKLQDVFRDMPHYHPHLFSAEL